MGALFIVSEIFLLISFILRKKSEKDINIIGFICTSLVLLICYNTFVCYVLTFFAILCKFWILATINIIVSLVIGFPIIKNKEIQKYTYNKLDLLYIAIIIITLLAIAYKNFGFPFNINYISGDPAHHYLTAIKFAKEETLMPNAELDDVYGDLCARKPASYVNSGLLMKCFCNDFNPIDCYYIFCGFGIFTLTLIGITLYTALNKYAKKKEHSFWAFLVALICTLGYPLNSLLFGFEYLTLGLLMIVAIIDMIYYYDNNYFKSPCIMLIFSLLNFGLFCSYYMFIPFVYPALGIYFYIKNYQKSKKIINKEIIIVWLVTLIIPFILGYIYHLEPQVYAMFLHDNLNQNLKTSIETGEVDAMVEYTKHIVNTGLKVNGFIYINLYSNILLLLPLTIYLFVIDIKEHKLKNELFILLLTILAIGFISLLLVGNYFGKVSMYYLSKNYFALWIILAFTNYKALISLFEKSRYLSRLFIISYIALMIICTIFSKVKIKEAETNENETVLSVMEIFGANKTLLSGYWPEYDQQELDIIEYAYKNLDYDSSFEIVTDHRAYYWSYVLLGYTDKEDKIYTFGGGQKMLENKHINLKNKFTKNKDLDYAIYFNKSIKYNELKKYIFKNAEIIYENEAGGIVKYNK